MREAGTSFSTSETVDRETPASLATSALVGPRLFATTCASPCGWSWSFLLRPG
jgi:hypothetical protein